MRRLGLPVCVLGLCTSLVVSIAVSVEYSSGIERFVGPRLREPPEKREYVFRDGITDLIVFGRVARRDEEGIEVLSGALFTRFEIQIEAYYKGEFQHLRAGRQAPKLVSLVVPGGMHTEVAEGSERREFLSVGGHPAPDVGREYVFMLDAVRKDAVRDYRGRLVEGPFYVLTQFSSTALLPVEEEPLTSARFVHLPISDVRYMKCQASLKAIEAGQHVVEERVPLEELRSRLKEMIDGQASP